MQETKSPIIKFVFLVNMAENLAGVSDLLNQWNCTNSEKIL